SPMAAPRPWTPKSSSTRGTSSGTCRINIYLKPTKYRSHHHTTNHHDTIFISPTTDHRLAWRPGPDHRRRQRPINDHGNPIQPGRGRGRGFLGADQLRREHGGSFRIPLV